METIFSKGSEFDKLENKLLKELIEFKGRHEDREKTQEQLNRGASLNRLSKIIRQIAAMDSRPDLIMDIEQHCEQFDLEFFAGTEIEKESRISSLRMIRSVKAALAAPLNQEQYMIDLADDVGERNMNKVLKVPQDAVHLFVKSQSQKLSATSCRMSSPPEKGYYRARQEALKAIQKIHDRNCATSLNLDQNFTKNCER